MGIYVDTVSTYDLQHIDERARQYGTRWAHLWGDELPALHEFARDLNLHSAWFQDRARFPHYDVVPSVRLRALRAGAEALSIQAWLTKTQEAMHPQAEQVEQIILRYESLIEPGDMLSLVNVKALIDWNEAAPRLSADEKALLAAYDGFVSMPVGQALHVTLYHDFRREA